MTSVGSRYLWSHKEEICIFSGGGGNGWIAKEHKFEVPRVVAVIGHHASMFGELEEPVVF